MLRSGLTHLRRTSGPALVSRTAVLRSLLVGLAGFSLSTPIAARAQESRLRVGHFPNVTHVQALVARNLERQGRPGFNAERLGRPVRIEWNV